MALVEPSTVRGDRTRIDGPGGEPSVTTSFENLVAGGQGVVTKRIDLALLEGQELLTRSVNHAALIGVGVVVAAGAWFALSGTFVLLVAPTADPVLRFGAFGLLNAALATALILFGVRESRPPSRVSSGTTPPAPVRTPTPEEKRN
jgi:uncharacterized membrane protein YqjE